MEKKNAVGETKKFAKLNHGRQKTRGRDLDSYLHDASL
jgi:hypothetical protein